ncbi:MAG: hypothetical protein AAGF47_01820 [Planctomycetota bacterium]
MIVRSSMVERAPATPDLRRRRTRAQAERISLRADVLDPPERRLIRDLFEDGRPCSAIARELGQNPRSIRRRVRSITRRLLDPRFEFVLTKADAWRPTRRRVAHEHFIRGHSLRETAEQLGLSLYIVRQHRDAIEALFEAHLAGDQGARR